MDHQGPPYHSNNPFSIASQQQQQHPQFGQTDVTSMSSLPTATAKSQPSTTAFDQPSQPSVQSHPAAPSWGHPHSQQPWPQSQGGSYYRQDQQRAVQPEQLVPAPAVATDGPSNNTAVAQQQQQQQQYYYSEKGGPAATAPFLRDFTLVAEAVRRVQMDRMMSEMERVTL
ncbi:hypothetical protein VTN31DRAFT_5682 [Thermomyces dupontii]|uniref:uncharacterized protein n=1 Tax=Talaromyces thermophilus TaxID=28565 RepID=UPI00374215B5